MSVDDGKGDDELTSISGKLDEVREAATKAKDVAIESSEVRADQFKHLEHKLTNHSFSTDLRFKAADERMDKLEKGLQENNLMTADMHEIIVSARAFFAALAKIGRGFYAVGQWFIKVIKAGGAIAGAIATMYALFYAYQHGWPMKP